MFRKLASTLFLLVITLGAKCQETNDDQIYYSNHSVTGGIGMESLGYVQYKYKFMNRNYLQTNSIIGIGTAPGDAEGGLPTHFNIAAGICQNIGIRPVLLTIGVAPIINFYDNVTYTNLNGLIGLKYEPKKKTAITIEAGYLHQLYVTHDNDLGFHFYFGFGISI